MNDLTCVWDARAELGEGVIWHAGEEAIYWLDIIQSKLHRFTSGGERRSWHFPGHISTVVPCETGGLLATFTNGLAHIEPETSKLTPLVPLETELADNRFNDGSSDSLGQFWFGSMDDKQSDSSGSFYRMDRQGQISKIDSFGHFCITNGPAFSTDGLWIYFTDTIQRTIYRAPLDGLGQPGAPEVYIQFSDDDGHPDGMCTDTEGGLWVCHFGGFRVSRFDSAGQIDQIIEMPVPNITKCAFGGPELNTLYITTAAISLDENQLAKHPLSGGLFAIDVSFCGISPKAVIRPSAQVDQAMFPIAK